MPERFGRGELPGESASHWTATSPDPDHEPLGTDLRADVAVVGGGAAGLSAAMALRDRGHAVVVLERDRIATGGTDGVLAGGRGLVYAHLREAFGPRAARIHAEATETAIETVTGRIAELGVDAGFERLPAYVYGDSRDPIEREVEAARAAGLESSLVTSTPPFDRAASAIRIEDRARIHPRRYLLGLAGAFAERGGTAIHERTPVTDVDPGRTPTLETPGGTVAADAVVLATGFPPLDRAGHAVRLLPRRSYHLGVRIDGPSPEGIYRRTGDPERSVVAADGALLVGGEGHRTGQGGSTAARYRRLADWSRERFPVRSIDRRWSAGSYVPADGLPSIGRAGVGADGVYVAAGFGSWGIAGGVAAGELLADAVDGVDRPELDLYDPLRLTPRATVAGGLGEGLDAASRVATDWLRSVTDPGREPREPGEGRVIRRGGRPVAVVRDRDGECHAVDARCPHGSCLVAWNDAEASWDCTCRGSRFAADGAVLEGPATTALRSVER